MPCRTISAPTAPTGTSAPTSISRTPAAPTRSPPSLPARTCSSRSRPRRSATSPASTPPSPVPHRLDTLCLARRGARVTGLDFSQNALRHAAGAGPPGRASRRGSCSATSTGAKDGSAASFDLVYTTWGTICWLPDIGRWGADGGGDAQSRRPALLRRHPPDDPAARGDRRPAGAHLRLSNADRACRSPSPPTRPIPADSRQFLNTENFEWVHPLSDILMALIDSGLAIEARSQSTRDCPGRCSR